MEPSELRCSPWLLLIHSEQEEEEEQEEKHTGDQVRPGSVSKPGQL